MTEKIELKEKILAVDLGAKNLWDDITDEQRKALKNEFWILNRYISNVKTSNRDHAAHYVLAVNEYFNKNWADIQKHPKLAWMLLCMCSYDGQKTFYHEWIAGGKKKANNKRQKLLESVYPNLKRDEIETLVEISTNDEFKELAREIGWTEKEIKDL
jgi:hypothetical protein